MKKRKWGVGKMNTGLYEYIRTPDHPFATKAGYVLEHRLVMEAKLGRYLYPIEKVHHLNGRKLDNRPENLVVISHRQHSRLHKTPSIRWELLENKRWLHKEFVELRKTPTKISKELGCCHQAVRLALQRHGFRDIPNGKPRPPIKHPKLHDPKWLREKLSIMPQCQVARLLGVTDSQVFTARMVYGIEITVKQKPPGKPRKP